MGPLETSVTPVCLACPPQVHLRLQWLKENLRGQRTEAEVSLAGFAFSVMGGLQDELFNFTVDKISWSAELTATEAKVTLRTVCFIAMQMQHKDSIVKYWKSACKHLMSREARP